MRRTDGGRRRGGPGNPFVLIVGLAVQAATTYAFLVIAGRALGPAGFGALSGLYVLLTSIATGLFQPLEQEITRRRGVEVARSTYDASLLRRGLRLGLVSAAAAVALMLLGWPVTLRMLGEATPLLVSLCLALPGYAVWFAVRGELAGRRELGWYAVQLVVEGCFRLVGAVAVVLLGVDDVGWFGLLFGLSPWVAAATGMLGRSRPEPVHDAPQPPSGLAGPVYLLVTSALATQLIVNAGPLVITLLATGADREQAGVFLAVLVVLRVPIFLFTALQPPLLTALAGCAATNQFRAFTRLLGRVVAAVVALGVAVVVVGTLVAPWVVELAFGFEDNLSRAQFAVLTASVGCLLLGLVLAQALLALAQHRRVLAGWLCGLVGLAAGAAVGASVVTQAANGLLLGSLSAVAGLGALLARALRSWRVRGEVPGALAVSPAPSAEP